MGDLRAADPRRMMDVPLIYRLFGAAVARPRQWAIFARDYVRARPGERILDAGCGAADVLAELPDGVAYVGFDQSERRLRSARARFGRRGTFFHRAVDRAAIDELGAGSFDVVVAHGLLHHLNDREALDFFARARAALKPDGRLVTADGCYLPGQSWLVRRLLAWDRGRHVRTEPGYVALASHSFASVTAAVRRDVARVPYAMVYLLCRG